MAQSAALISTEELARRMGAPALRIFDCTTYLRPRPEGGYNAESGRANYDKGHLPGAAFLDLGGELSDPQSRLRFTLPPLDQLTRAFAAKGIGHGTFVVLYSHATPTWATRVWWMLRAAFEGAGAAPDKRVLVYCGGGIAATLDAFVLTALLGHKNVSVYGNSMQEWSNDPSLPMEAG